MLAARAVARAAMGQNRGTAMQPSVVRPYQLLCIICRIGADCGDDLGDERPPRSCVPCAAIHCARSPYGATRIAATATKTPGATRTP